MTSKQHVLVCRVTTSRDSSSVTGLATAIPVNVCVCVCVCGLDLLSFVSTLVRSPSVASAAADAPLAPAPRRAALLNNSSAPHRPRHYTTRMSYVCSPVELLKLLQRQNRNCCNKLRRTIHHPCVQGIGCIVAVKSILSVRW